MKYINLSRIYFVNKHFLLAQYRTWVLLGKISPHYRFTNYNENSEEHVSYVTLKSV